MNGPSGAPPLRGFGAREDAPTPGPTKGLWHHGARGLLLLLTSALIALLFPAWQGRAPIPQRGSVAPRDVIARVPFSVPKPSEDLRRERGEAALGVPAVYRYDGAAAESLQARLRDFFARVDSAVAQRGADPRAAARAELQRARIPLTLSGVEALADSTSRRAVEAALASTVGGALRRGVADVDPRERGISVLRVRDAASDRLVPAESVLTREAFVREASSELPSEAGADAAELQRLLLIRLFRPTLRLDTAATREARAQAAAAVDTVAARYAVGQKVIGAHERVGVTEEARLRAYAAALEAAGGRTDRAGSRAAGFVGALLVNLLLLGIVGALLYVSRRSLYDDARAVVFLAGIGALVAGVAAAVAGASLPVQLVPVPFAALLIAALWGGRLALALGLVLGVVLGEQAAFAGSGGVAVLSVAAAAGAFAVPLVQRRYHTWLVMALVGAATAVATLALALPRGATASELVAGTLWSAAGALASSLLAVGVLPLAEWFTGVTTNQTLMELADPRQPLLRRLALEAPGTYAHTIIVANLAESVCAAVGANALLARVGVLYHDIGKVAKPQFFIENQPRGRNPHDKLKPAMSAAIVRSHVADGLRLAEEARLPPAVRDFIAQHHGTQPISFFLERAREADPALRPDAAEFAYAGPRPRTREVAIVMLADSVESATRALADPAPEKITELVERIVAAKIAAGQLEDAPLTLRELRIIKETLVAGLSSMHHQRIDYPAGALAGTPPTASAP